MSFRGACFFTITLTCFLFVLVPAIIVFAVDPFQIYRLTEFKQAGYSNIQNYQHDGWINTVLSNPDEHYDSIVIGSSTMANYTQTLINERLPWGKVMNLSINGSTPIMQAAVARSALKHNPDMKHILWDIHFFYTYDADWDNSKPPDSFPYYLYDDSILNDSEYLLNVTNVVTSIRFLLGNFNNFTFGIEDNGPFYESLLAGGRFAAHGSRDYKLNTILPAIIDRNRVLPANNILAAYLYPSIDRNLLDIILPFCNTDKDIVLTFSPEDRSSYTQTTNDEHIFRRINMRKYLVEKTSQCKNIRVFAFDDVDWITAHPENYADNFHYVIDVNRYIINSVPRINT